MTTQQVVDYLKKSVMTANAGVEDPAFAAMADADFEAVLTVALMKYSSTAIVSNIPKGLQFIVIQVAKKEIFYRLASANAPMYKLGADKAELNKQQRFDHYLSIIAQLDKEITQYEADFGATPTVENVAGNAYGNSQGYTVDVVLPKNYFTLRNMDLTPPPVVIELQTDSIYRDQVELSWGISGVQRFWKYQVYLSTQPVLDIYSGSIADNFAGRISSLAECVVEITDIHQAACRIEGLNPETQYYVAVAIREQNGNDGFSEITFTTLGV